MSSAPPLTQVAVAVRTARAKLKTPERAGSPWALLAAACLAALSALVFAFAVIMGPPTAGRDARLPPAPALRPLQ
jgi:hypothetical protein